MPDLVMKFSDAEQAEVAAWAAEIGVTLEEAGILFMRAQMLRIANADPCQRLAPVIPIRRAQAEKGTEK